VSAKIETFGKLIKLLNEKSFPKRETFFAILFGYFEGSMDREVRV
jgi:hypothetical protein